jgi:hypothetical protein
LVKRWCDVEVDSEYLLDHYMRGQTFNWVKYRVMAKNSTYWLNSTKCQSSESINNQTMLTMTCKKERKLFIRIESTNKLTNTQYLNSLSMSWWVIKIFSLLFLVCIFSSHTHFRTIEQVQKKFLKFSLSLKQNHRSTWRLFFLFFFLSSEIYQFFPDDSMTHFIKGFQIVTNIFLWKTLLIESYKVMWCYFWYFSSHVPLDYWFNYRKNLIEQATWKEFQQK